MSPERNWLPGTISSPGQSFTSYVMCKLVLWGLISLWLTQPPVSAVISDQLANEQSLPNGYYVFARAPPNSKPPKVRKPPYLPISADCTGLQDSNGIVSKNNLCGDLNRGFIPRNPMGQYLLGQPYPFDLIKNKTLQFLSKTLPYLKEEIDSIPKVARFVKPSEFFENNSKRYKREASDVSESVAGNSKGGSISSGNVTLPEGSVERKETNNSSSKLGRHNQCEGNAICQALESLKEEGLFSKSFLSNVVSAVGNVASTNSIASLLDQYSQLSQNESNRNTNSNKFGISQLLSSVSSISDSASGASSANPSPSEPSNLYSPLLSIIDYIQSLQTPKYASKRRTPSEPEDYLPEGPEKPQTPCMSTEEYISPTYARNYQGVWKYVVQIPNEGYFTQTVQQTTCLKTKCDLIEGTCRESPRWVSLLVAEIFYPNVYFPANQIMPMLYKQQQMQQTPSQPQGAPVPSQPYQVINSNHNQANKRPSQPSLSGHSVNKIDLNALANLLKRGDHAALQNVELLGRRARASIDKATGSSTDLDADQEDNNEKKHCDGYDKIGCYIVRVYYDWFLVNGSCKCWKSSGSGLNINETIKRIFIGKWKKK